MIDRRRLLLATTAASAAGLAGCIDQFGSGDPEGDGDANGDDEDEPVLEDAAADGFVEGYQVERFGADVDGPSGQTLRDADRAATELGLDERDDETGAALDAVVETTDFESEHLVLIQAEGPNLCYRLELETVAATDEDGLTVEASAVDDSADDEDCGQAVVELGMLVRVVYEADATKPTEGSISVTDGFGTGTASGWATEGDTEAVDEGG